MKGLVSFLIGAITGSLVGATLALLLTPSSGNDLRGQIKDRIDAVQAQVKQAAASRRAEMEQQLIELRAPRQF
jgi:gas vesicle protein